MSKIRTWETWKLFKHSIICFLQEKYSLHLFPLSYPSSSFSSLLTKSCVTTLQQTWYQLVHLMTRSSLIALFKKTKKKQKLDLVQFNTAICCLKTLKWLFISSIYFSFWSFFPSWMILNWTGVVIWGLFFCNYTFF